MIVFILFSSIEPMVLLWFGSPLINCAQKKKKIGLFRFQYLLFGWTLLIPSEVCGLVLLPLALCVLHLILLQLRPINQVKGDPERRGKLARIFFFFLYLQIVQFCSLRIVVLLTCSRFFIFFFSNLSSSGCSHAGSLFIRPVKSRKKGWLVTNQPPVPA